jgi:threonyl-tRNA synthetase
MRLSLHDPENLGKKYVNEPELWIKTEQLVREALIEGNIPFEEIPGEAAFYGPKIDVQVWSAIGREFTLATNQVDFAIPKRFDLVYVDENNNDQTPLCIHRAPLGTHERFVGFLIEHFGGDFPLWLAPKQVIILPISDKYLSYADALEKKMLDNNIRVSIDSRSEKMGAKIRDAEIKKIPMMLIVGEKEENDGSASVRRRHIGDLGSTSIDELIPEIVDEITTRRRA